MHNKEHNSIANTNTYMHTEGIHFFNLNSMSSNNQKQLNMCNNCTFLEGNKNNQ